MGSLVEDVCAGPGGCFTGACFVRGEGDGRVLRRLCFELGRGIITSGPEQQVVD